eukprot:scaffold1630_cov298-Prasinococcus_capsulatus_cf.AAC.9
MLRRAWCGGVDGDAEVPKAGTLIAIHKLTYVTIKGGLAVRGVIRARGRACCTPLSPTAVRTAPWACGRLHSGALGLGLGLGLGHSRPQLVEEGQRGAIGAPADEQAALGRILQRPHLRVRPVAHHGGDHQRPEPCTLPPPGGSHTHQHVSPHACTRRGAAVARVEVVAANPPTQSAATHPRRRAARRVVHHDRLARARPPHPHELALPQSPEGTQPRMRTAAASSERRGRGGARGGCCHCRRRWRPVPPCRR